MYQLKILVNDIETYPECFFASFFDPETKMFTEFEITPKRSDLYSLVKYLQSIDCWVVTFNGLNFDFQVLTWILLSYEEWYDLSPAEVCLKISKFASKIIEDQNYNQTPPYKESDLFCKTIDLFKIHHFDNKNKRTSLKWCEYMMDSPNIEDMDESAFESNLTDEKIEEIKNYCRNDVMETYRLYLWTIGECENDVYKGKNAIELRFDLLDTINLPCINWSDVKIGEERNKRDYMALTGKSYDEIMPKKVRYFYGKKYKEFFPNTVEFKTKEVKSFLKEFGETIITNKKQEFKLKLGENDIVIARGGIHSSEKPRFIESDEKYQYKQIDIGSQYPNFYRKMNLYPLHLGPEANRMVVYRIKQRLEAKALFEKTKDRKQGSIAESGKLSLNGGLYGKLKQKGSFLEDHIVALSITIGCQLEILMIVEALILEGFRVVSLNTDGFDVVVEKSRIKEFNNICKFYQKKIGNDEIGKLEHTDFDWIAQTSVNDYIAKKSDGTFKYKGDFKLWSKLNENKSRRIIPLALSAYFERGIDPEEFITNHDVIYDFCIGLKESMDFYYELVDKAGNRQRLRKVVRYYVSTDGKKLLKIKKPGSEAAGNSIQECEAPSQKVWLCTVVNKMPDKPISEFNIDYDYYINKTKNIILSIEQGRKRNRVINVDPNQIKLF